VISEIKLNSIPFVSAQTPEELKNALNQVIDKLNQQFERMAANVVGLSRPGTANDPWKIPTSVPPLTVAAGWTSINLGLDSPPSDAVGAWLLWGGYNAATYSQLEWRPNTSGSGRIVAYAYPGHTNLAQFPVWFGTDKTIQLRVTNQDLTDKVFYIMSWIR
jgi:hypothetical protein